MPLIVSNKNGTYHNYPGHHQNWNLSLKQKELNWLL